MKESTDDVNKSYDAEAVPVGTGIPFKNTNWRWL
jgi:hypothetical protein